jgi:hypothetical protein
MECPHIKLHKKEFNMIKFNNTQSPVSCQEQNPFNFFSLCITKYCQNLLEVENYPWGKKSNPIQFYVQSGNIKLSKDQKLIINFLHREYFSRGKACWLKRKNIIKQANLNPEMKPYNLTRIINRLVKRGILFKIKMETHNFERVFILPNVQSKKQTQKSFEKFEKDNTDIRLTYEKYEKFIRKNRETETGGGLRLSCK